MAWAVWAAVWAVVWAVAWAAVWAVECGRFRRPVCRSRLWPEPDASFTDPLVSLSSPDDEEGLILPQEGEKLQILGDVAKVNDNPRVQKALKRLATAKAPTSLSQLVMWRVAADLDWNTIAQLSQVVGQSSRARPGQEISWTISTS